LISAIFFCAMQGKWDKRADQDQMRPELREAGKLRYADAMVDYAAKFYAPYSKNWVLFAQGNHEYGFAQKMETNLTERLAERLRADGSQVQAQVTDVQGWVRFCFSIRTSCWVTNRLRFHHGYGGGGPVTRDSIQAQRQMAFLGNADMIVSGHTHDFWHMIACMESLDHNGKPVERPVDLVKVPGYKNEYSVGRGWAANKGMPPKVLGAWWLRFWVEGDVIKREFIPAR
jgi:hypothetical protein